MYTILLMIFCFTFFTYNMQRIVKFKLYKVNINNVGERLRWVKKNILVLKISSIIFGIIGLLCTYYININCWLILIPMGACSFFYVIPLLPFYKKSPTLRKIPFLKIFVIALVWCIVIVGIPLIDSQLLNVNNSGSIKLFLLTLLQVFLFVIGITIPFDIRDINYDKLDKLKTIPNTIGIIPSIFFAEFSLICSIWIMYIIHGNNNPFYVLFFGHLITMIMIMNSSDKRKELFFSGWVEGCVLILYCSVLIADYFYFL